MESIGASERVMEYLDRDIAPQLSKGRTLPDFRGKVADCCPDHCSPAQPPRLHAQGTPGCLHRQLNTRRKLVD